MISDYFDEYVSVERMGFVAEGSEITQKKEFLPYISNLCCNIQPIDASISKDITDGFGKDLVLFCANNDIIEGDRIVREGGDAYRVVAVENFKGLPGVRVKHAEIIIRAFES
jgi:hypothetical protein